MPRTSIGPVRPIYIGSRAHSVTLENPATPVPDGDGGFTEVWTSLDPASVFASIEPATASKLERLGPNTVTNEATHIIAFPYHSGVTTKTRISLGARVFQVTGVSNEMEQGINTIAICTETVA